MAQPRVDRDPNLLNNQIAAVKREIALRERNYPRWVDGGSMTQGVADYEIAVFRKLLERLEAESKKGELQL
jgi:hypothetical protein